MIIERIVYCLVCLVLFGYIIKKYLGSRSGMYLSLLAIQLVCMVTQIIALISGIYVDIFMQIYILMFNIVLPSMVFFAEYLNINLEEFIEIKLGDFYARRNKYDNAIEKYKKAIVKNNSNSETFAKLGRIYNAKGDRRTAFDRFARAIELNRNDYRSYYEIGVIFNDMGKQADAQIVLDNSLRIKPDFTPASELLAVVLCSQNKYDEAINVYKNATRYDPDNYQLYYRMGVVRTELRDFTDAKECYEKAIELNPSLYQAYFSLGQINLLKGELEQAEKMFKKSLVSKELTAKSYYQLAKVYILNDEEIKAVTYLGYAIDIDSSYKYKAESEPLFARIKDYITGLSMANRVMQQAEFTEKLKKDKNIDFEEEREELNRIQRKNEKFEEEFLNEEESTSYTNDIHKEEEEKSDVLGEYNVYKEEIFEDEKAEEKANFEKEDDDGTQKLDIFEKFKKLKKEEEEKAERLRREQKIRQLEQLRAYEREEKDKNDISPLPFEDEEAPVVVRTVGISDGEEAEKEIQRLEELKKIRNFEFENKNLYDTKEKEENLISEEQTNTTSFDNIIQNKIDSGVEVGENENFEDEDTMDEPHFDFMDRFKRR